MCLQNIDSITNTLGYGIHIGQNWATGFPNWGAAIKAWYDEVSIYRYGQDPNTYLPNGFAAIGHYTQVGFINTVFCYILNQKYHHWLI